MSDTHKHENKHANVNKHGNGNENGNLNLNITISKHIIHKLSYSIIPILQTTLKTESLYNLINKYISVDNKYKSILEHIEDNIKHKNINIASLTIDDTLNTANNSNSNNKNNNNNNKEIKVNKTLKHTKNKYLKLSSRHSKLTNNRKENTTSNKSITNSPFTKLHQLFIVCINNNSFNKTDSSELLESLRVAGTTIYNILNTNNIKSFNLVELAYNKTDTTTQDTTTPDTTTPDTTENLQHNKKQATIPNTLYTNTSSIKYLETILEGILLTSYKFTKYKTSHALNKNENKYNLQYINLVIHKYIKNDETIIYSCITKLINIIKSVFIARDLINEPANTAKSTKFINIIKEFIKTHNLDIKLEIFEKDKLTQLGMGLLLGVGKGSSNENAPKILIMKYNGKTKTKTTRGTSHPQTQSQKQSQPSYVLLGKGITFDTGGLNLKSGKHMVEMKTDLSGAAAVSAFLLGYALNKGSKCIYVICPFAENSIGKDAIKPSDVLTAYNGSTVEITNTDAEGRLILADCLSYIVEKYPKSIIIDLATLTGQQESLSSKMFSNILAVNSDIEVNKLIKCGKDINELLVPLPIMEKYLDKLKSYVADIQNVSFTSSADIIMSSLFMRQFIHKQTKWINIDIAGQSYKLNNIIKYSSPEASGIGVRLLFNYFDI